MSRINIEFLEKLKPNKLYWVQDIAPTKKNRVKEYSGISHCCFYATYYPRLKKHSVIISGQVFFKGKHIKKVMGI